MFQTLGNLAVDPRAGLLFVDWESATTLQLTGRARIIWDEDEIRARPGAERLIDYEIDAVHEHKRALPMRWKLIEPSRLNPPVRGPDDPTPSGRNLALPPAIFKRPTSA